MMDEYEQIFYERKSKLQSFAKDLKDVFDKHNVKLKNETDVYHGGIHEYIEININGHKWLNDDFESLLTLIGVLQ